MGANGQAANNGHTCFSEAFAAAQGEMRAAEKNCTNPHFRSKYADLASIIDASKPLARHGIARAQTTEIRDSQLVLVTRLLFGGGVGAESVFPLPVIADPQKMGAALTYFKRFALSMVCGIAADDDDDGNTAAREAREQPKRVETTVIRADAPREASYANDHATFIVKKKAELAPVAPTLDEQEATVTEALHNQIRAAGDTDELRRIASEIKKHKFSDKYRVPLLEHWTAKKAELEDPETA